MKEYKSEISAIVHSTMQELQGVGIISKTTLKEYDELCLKPVNAFSPEEIREIREKEMVSQPIFAKYLNVSKGLISSWERGVKKPGGPALRLLTIVKEKGLAALL